MTWLGQVLHVARKDVREEAWPLGAYLGVIAIAALTPFARHGLGYTAAFALIVFLLGMIVAAAVVQSDSPTASESFWGSRPFRPTAMLGAKVLMAAIIVLVPSIAQGVALVGGFDANAGQAAFAVADSANVYALWLLAAMAIAGLTRDIRTFIVAFAAILVTLALALAIGYDLRNTLAPPRPDALVYSDGFSSSLAVAATRPGSLVGPVLLTIIAVSSAVALLVFLYRRRDARRRIWIVAITVVAVAVTAAFNADLSVPQFRSSARAQKATTASSPIRLELQRSDRLGKEEEMILRVAVDTDTVSRRLILAVPRVIVHLKDGTDVTVWGNGLSSALVAAGNPLAANIRWLRSERDRFATFALPVSFEQRSAISKGVIGLELVGTVFALEPRTIRTLPLEPNRSFKRDGIRLRIVSVTPAPDGGTVVVHATSVLQPEPFPLLDRFGTLGGRQYALVNEARREAVVPFKTGGGGVLNLLVLPSMSLGDETITLQLRTNSTVPRDSAWFMGARLALVQWTLSGQYSVRVPIVEVPTPPEPRSRDSTVQRSGNQLLRLEAVLRP